MKSLGKRLFYLVEGEQGYSYISDAVVYMDDDEVLSITYESLQHHKNCISILQDFLKNETKKEIGKIWNK